MTTLDYLSSVHRDAVLARREGDPARLVADATLARMQPGWQPQYADLATIIGNAWKWETRGG